MSKPLSRIHMENDSSSRDDQEFILRLDEAAQAHVGWSQRVLRCAVLHSLPGEDVLAEDAHCRCTFGGWFQQYREQFDVIDAMAARRLDEQHRLMHDSVRNICKGLLVGSAIDASLVDDFEKSQVSVLADLTFLKAQFLAHSARLDALTGLPLRYGLEEEFNRCRAQAKRGGELAVMVMLDVDHFKRVNDDHGHTAGDLALQHIAQVLMRNCRTGERLFRYGGEEFIALLQATSREAAQQGAERMLQALRDTPLQLPDGHVLNLRASAGLAVAGAGESLTDIVSRVDQALYAAKAAGRDTWRWS